MSSSDLSPLTEAIRGIPITGRPYLLIHAGLRTLRSVQPQAEYADLGRNIIRGFEEAINPKGFFIPVFTHSFTKSGIFHINHSRSEVGRFSEELRTTGGWSRTFDPVFSWLDSAQLTGDFQPLAERNAFSEDSAFQAIQDAGTVALNLGCDRFVCSHLHYYEQKHQVPYRMFKEFTGQVCDENNHWTQCRLSYYVRKSMNDIRWNRSKVEADLAAAGILHQTLLLDRVPVSWMRLDDLESFMDQKISADPCYLIAE